jgi:hypothetical protein
LGNGNETEKFYTLQERVGKIYEKAYIISARDLIERTDNTARQKSVKDSMKNRIKMVNNLSLSHARAHTHRYIYIYIYLDANVLSFTETEVMIIIIF